MFNLRVTEVAHHRNGCFGEPFHAVRFTADGDSLLGFVFEGEGRVVVIDPALALDTVAFGVNSWRGDQYEPQLRDAIAHYEAARSVNPAHPARPALRLVAGG